ncbi:MULTISPECIES: TrbC/VirB2 family protein [unclassified Lactobacillus]|uniref:TrbC/VirB2 family protein n=1 Tax=unclassified Lactobacillus TaxID=2620435 RepID=UPI000EFCC47E|nr:MULTISPECIES: TrbC/VirB2 family protein [unclassified Lactobacillus]RMC38122.1 hypothetical protein F5ESL0237_07745 [Lactobacillus sp. ESL0237]RMC42667.1 hypothetical protein F5ESL0234_07710 [Lactobacillus sp. ESL0234]RMC43350.1 hypothetical protein F5ESL0236_07770 [Lactobacillus sp. ESL0236]RMC47880.1 hypothetical protein F5ESL0225_08070 [Lactobacillus sp. ESL0225]
MNYLNNQLFLAAAKGAPDFIGKISNVFTNLQPGLKALGGILAVVVVIIVGMLFMGGGRLAQLAKAHLGNVIIGVVLIAVATVLVPWVMGIFS